MYSIAKISAKERNIIIGNTAFKTKMHEAIVEKDFWVCLMLDYLFHKSPWHKPLAFKGGTSLSKAYRAISRFSKISISSSIGVYWDMNAMNRGLSEAEQSRMLSARRQTAELQHLLKRNF